jgi:predicted signal transduction protein with EAL and GGDEF domain
VFGWRQHLDGRFRLRLFPFSYLRSFPFDRIKIDCSFVRNPGGNRDSQAIMRAILALDSSLGITVITGGIDSGAELVCLRKEAPARARASCSAGPAASRETCVTCNGRRRDGRVSVPPRWSRRPLSVFHYQSTVKRFLEL